MAKMTFKLPEETIRKMEALGSHYDAVTSAVLEEGVSSFVHSAEKHSAGGRFTTRRFNGCAAHRLKKGRKPARASALMMSLLQD